MTVMAFGQEGGNSNSWAPFPPKWKMYIDNVQMGKYHARAPFLPIQWESNPDSFS